MSRKRYKQVTLQHAIHDIVHNGPLDVPELADEIGCSESLLYRTSNPHDDEANFPVKRLIPAMRAQKDFGPLHHLASRCGFAIFKIPAKLGRMSQEDIAKLQLAQATAMKALCKFFDGDIDQQEAMQAIDDAIAGLARARKSVQHGTKQEELL